jgi:hypothetical protein
MFDHIKFCTVPFCVKRKAASAFVHESDFQLWNQLLTFHEIWYKHCAIVLECDCFPRMHLMYYYDGFFIL